MKHLVITDGPDLCEGMRFETIESTKIAAGDSLLIRVNDSHHQTTGRILRLADSGARPVIEVDGKRWWLRPVDVVHVDVPCGTWIVGGEGEGD